MSEDQNNPGVSISRSTHSASGVPDNDTLDHITKHFSSCTQDLSGDTTHQGWYKPGNLPHFDAASTYQMVTYHLADSLPAEKLKQFEWELKTIDPKRIDSERRKMMEGWLDAGHGSCILSHKICAQCVVDSWVYFDGSHYKLIAWTVMPNHVHVLFQQLGEHRLADIVASWKKFTARKINAMLDEGLIPGSVALQSDTDGMAEHGNRRSRKLWQRDYWDRFIRNEEHLNSAINYILNNAVKAGLVKSSENWPWCGVKQD